MPIRIEYGAQVSPGLPAMAQTAMRIRAEAAAAALAARRSGGGGGGRGGGRGGQTNLAQQKYDLAAQQAYYNKEAASQKSDDAIQQLEYKANLEAQGLESAYTVQQRQELAQINNSRQKVKLSEDHSDEEKVTMLRALDHREYGIEETIVPADPNKMKFPKDQAQSLQEMWVSESGDLMAYTAKGEPIVRQDFKDTKEGIQAQWDYEDRQETNKFMREIATEEIRDPVTKKLRLRNEKEITQIRANLEASMGTYKEEETLPGETPGRGDTIFQQMAEEQVAEQQATEQQQSGYTGLAEQLGIQPNEKEQNLPGDIGAMFAILRTVDERYTDKNGKIDLSKAPPELIQNLEIMEQRAASWLANEQLNRNRKPIPRKKKLGRKKVGSFMGGTMTGQF